MTLFRYDLNCATRGQMIQTNDIETVVQECFAEMKTASREKYDADKADRTASLFLMAQMKLSFVIEEVEMKARHAKNEITRLEGIKYFEYKTSNGEKKITEKMLENHIAKEPEIIEAKLESSKQDAILRKWNYLLNVLKDGHIYFRNIGKNKTWSE